MTRPLAEILGPIIGPSRCLGDLDSLERMEVSLVVEMEYDTPELPESWQTADDIQRWIDDQRP